MHQVTFHDRLETRFQKTNQGTHRALLSTTEICLISPLTLHMGKRTRVVPYLPGNQERIQEMRALHDRQHRLQQSRQNKMRERRQLCCNPQQKSHCWKLWKVKKSAPTALTAALARTTTKERRKPKRSQARFFRSNGNIVPICGLSR